jgi:hypothetical protein
MKEKRYTITSCVLRDSRGLETSREKTRELRQRSIEIELELLIYLNGAYLKSIRNE